LVGVDEIHAAEWGAETGDEGVVLADAAESTEQATVDHRPILHVIGDRTIPLDGRARRRVATDAVGDQIRSSRIDARSLSACQRSFGSADREVLARNWRRGSPVVDQCGAV